MLHRFLFFEITKKHNSGKTFGNFQILVLIFLKISMLGSAFFIEKEQFLILLFLSIIVILYGNFQFSQAIISQDTLESIKKYQPLKIKDIKDFFQHPSFSMFVIDGVFLYLESFFWVVTLYLVAGESFASVALLIIALSLIFGAIHWKIKSILDTIPYQKLFLFLVALYAFSWILRSMVLEIESLSLLALLLIFIAFSTILFRLTLNKRFYDNARSQSGQQYMIMKSYITQASLSVFFLILGYIAMQSTNNISALNIFYLGAAPLAIMYMKYPGYDGEK
ncbi:hypothetical protein HON22_04620 [Candidatus Peregrinibacteria bacterium]|nr:hypothetical protein [Candidatus Peregrinibacteria bacterium]